jgi:hypothetical protein
MKDHPDNYQPLTAKYVPEHSFTVFDMTSDELAVEQINLEGKVVDSFRVTKPARQAPEKPVTPLPAR